jgi:hypothetical protein
MAVIIGYTPDGQPITIGDEERRAGLYVLGKSGTGKSTLLVNMIAQDIKNGHGVFFLDPHGEAIDDLLLCADRNRLANDAFILDPQDEEASFGINLLACKNIHSMNARTDTYTRAYSVFTKLWEDKEQEWGLWLQSIIENILYVFIENQDYTMAEMPLFLRNEEFRNKLLDNVRYNDEAVSYWRIEFSERQAQPFITRLRMLLSHPHVKHIICQKETTIDFDRIMSRRKILLVKLSVNLPSDIKKFIGTILLSELTHAAMTRTSRRQFCIYVDEVQNFATSEDFATLFSQARKFAIATTIAHVERHGQFADNKKMQGATAASANKIFFQTTVRDAEELAPEFAQSPKATETPRGAELVISPHAVEDIWDKGYPDEDIMYIRNKYFWIVDLLRNNPREKYFQFNILKMPREEEPTFNDVVVEWESFEDWDMYCSSAEMLKQGISLLNKYCYDWMQQKYQMKRVTNEQISIILKIMECFSGVMGLRPVMFSFLPDANLEKLMRIIQKNDVRLAKDRLALAKEALLQLQKDTAGTGWMFPRKEEFIGNLQREIHDPTIITSGIAQILAGQKIASNVTRKIVQNLGISHGMSVSDAETLFEWEIRQMLPEEKKTLEELTELIANFETDHEAYKKNHTRVTKQYFTRMNFIQMVIKFGAKIDNLPNETMIPYLKQVQERVHWQLLELQYFITWCFVGLPGILQKNPIKIPSGKYEEKHLIDRTQADLINLMSQELTNLPRFTAFTKLAYEQDDAQDVFKGKMKTAKLHKIVCNDLQSYSNSLTTAIGKHTADLNYVLRRYRIEKELRRRQNAWRNKPQEPPLEDPPPTIA